MSTTASKPKVLPAIGIVLRMLGQMPRSHSPSFSEEGGSTAYPHSLRPGPRGPEARVGEGIHRPLFLRNLGPEAWGRHGEGGSTASPPRGLGGPRQEDLPPVLLRFREGRGLPGMAME